MSQPLENKQPHKPATRKEMSRRQFLSYTLGGAGAFMMGGAALPMVRFAVDPLLQEKAVTDYIKVVEESKLTAEPQEFSFKRLQVDGWYEDEAKLKAWITKDESGILALSPVCKHLGCTVGWNNSAAHKDQYFCPCHGAFYTKDGKQMAIARAPLDEYEVKVDNGIVYLGAIKPNTRVK
ncbi:ubiquinol-cytochrome c reductase iron-sulfur subunit [Paenibacillus sp. SC116]|uniref:QcrA and Rieske domain-containing protein n=1 Tax=Paenibacillus sp. SC116 TaxID=2968986 RepID=UPI00215B485F|nr:ubiquinol-cytochrome c reductase iron-sulfur subunit [Paenibacillus sp. SC116]MCR8842942.1 ubiquinol-cytochrome c reductase iron-sulfur subunit [Paenibacillus sp. SC116]